MRGRHLLPFPIFDVFQQSVGQIQKLAHCEKVVAADLDILRRIWYIIHTRTFYHSKGNNRSERENIVLIPT